MPRTAVPSAERTANREQARPSLYVTSAPVDARSAVVRGPATSRGAAGKPSTKREELFAELKPLVRRLIQRFGEDPEMRRDLEGEIYYRFCVLLDAYDPSRGVPLRPY